MQEFFLFVMQAVVVISIFWYIGVNFFKHSHEISEWLDRRRLKKIADEHKSKVFDVSKVYQEQFGFLETPEYVRERMVEIQNELLYVKSGDQGVNVNALEFIFLIDELKTDVLKTEKGIYIVSRKNINDLLRQQERDAIHYAKKMREYALRFLPKEGEPIELEADQLLYWVRNGMLKRPSSDVGNRTFTLSPGLQEVCLELKEDFIEPHYLLEVVSHSDYLKIKERRVQIDERTNNVQYTDEMDKLIEGRLVSFSDNTRKMKIGNEVITYDHLGNTWREDLNGTKLNGKQNQKSNQHEPGLSANDFIKNESKAVINEADETEREARLPSYTSNKIKNMLNGDINASNNEMFSFGQSITEKTRKAEITKSDFVKKEEPKSVELKKPQPVRENIDKKQENEIVKAETPVQAKFKPKFNKSSSADLKTAEVATFVEGSKKEHPIIDGFFDELKDDAFKYQFVQRIKKNKFPYGVIGYDGFAYVSIKTLLENTFKYLSQSGKESFVSEIEGPQRKISDHRLTRLYQALSDAGIILFRNTLLRHDTLMFKHNEQRYKIKAVRLSPEFCKSLPDEEIEIIKDAFKVNKNRWTTIGFLDENKEGTNQPRSNSKKMPEQVEVNLKKAVPTKIPSGAIKEQRSTAKPIAEPIPADRKIESDTIEPKAVNLSRPESGSRKETSNKMQPNEAKKQKMRRETFIKKFCSEDQLFNDEVFKKMEKDCDQFYYTFRINPEDSNEALLFFDYEKFAKLLWPFLEKEGLEYNESNKFLNAFLKDDLKGDLSARFIYSVPDKTVFKIKMASLRIPIESLDGLRLDVGYRGGYREIELKKNLDNAVVINDKTLVSELQELADSIREKRFIECKEGE